MKLSKESMWGKFIWYTTTNYPKNLCATFWTGVWSFIIALLSPVTFIHYLFDKKWFNREYGLFCGERDGDRLAISVVVHFLFGYWTIIGYCLKFFTDTEVAWWGPIAFYIIALAILLVMVTVGLLIELWKKIPRKDKKEEVSVTREYIKAAKNKVCPLVTWE